MKGGTEDSPAPAGAVASAPARYCHLPTPPTQAQEQGQGTPGPCCPPSTLRLPEVGVSLAKSQGQATEREALETRDPTELWRRDEKAVLLATPQNNGFKDSRTQLRESAQQTKTRGVSKVWHRVSNNQATLPGAPQRQEGRYWACWRGDMGLLVLSLHYETFLGRLC